MTKDRSDKTSETKAEILNFLSSLNDKNSDSTRGLLSDRLQEKAREIRNIASKTELLEFLKDIDRQKTLVSDRLERWRNRRDRVQEINYILWVIVLITMWLIDRKFYPYLYIAVGASLLALTYQIAIYARYIGPLSHQVLKLIELEYFLTLVNNSENIV